MTVDGANLAAYERAMGEAILAAFREAVTMSSPSTRVQDVESGGFPTVGLNVGRGSTPIAPVVVFRAETRISDRWLSDQSKDGGARALSGAAACVGVALAAEAVGRPDGTAAVGIDRSSVSARFARREGHDGFHFVSFSVGVAVYPPAEPDDIVVRTEQEIVDVGTIDVESGLPDEAAAMVARVQESIRSAVESPEVDAAFSAILAGDRDDIFAI